MSARTTTAGWAVLRRLAPPVLISLAAGLGPLVPSPQAALAALPTGVSSIAAGGYHSCAIESGKAYCWGDNEFGELGNGSTTNSSVPVAVDTSGVLAGKTLTQITVGNEDHEDTCALDSTGAAYCWGDNQAGALGDGSTKTSTVPVAVDTSGVLAGRTLTQITAGESACALDTAGTAYCWGYNGSDQLGDGSTADHSSIPVAVDTSGVLAGKTLTQIAAGVGGACAVDIAGAAYCWGADDYGELGNGSSATLNDSPVPVAVDTSGALAGKTLIQITAGDADTCAVDSAGTAYCWGYNGRGELGNGSRTNSSVPVAVDTSGVLAGKALTKSPPAGCTYARWTAREPPTAGATTTTANSATATPPAPTSPWPQKTAASWPAKPSPRSPPATSTCPATPGTSASPVHWIAQAPRTAQAATHTANSATTAPPRATCQS